MLKASEYFSFKSNWSTNNDLQLIVTCSQFQKVGDWTRDQDEQDVDVQPGEDKAVFTSNNGEAKCLEISCSCTPHLNVSIFGIEIVSTVRTLEFYSRIDGYLKTCKGRQLLTDNVDSGDSTLYYCGLKIEESVDDIVVKFISSGGGQSVIIHQLDFKLLQGDPGSQQKTGMIDMGKVREYLHSMGDNLPAQAADMMDSVEQFQKSQMANFSHLTSGTTLSDLLSKVSQSHEQSTNHQSADLSLTNQQAASKTPPPDSAPSPLQALMGQMMQGETNLFGSDGGGEGGMFHMLQNICGKMGQLRVKELKSQTDNAEVEGADSPLEKSDQNTESKQPGSELHQPTNESIEQLKIHLEQTVSQMIESSEQRLKQYIDTSLLAMESRLCDKMEAILKLVEKNGHSNS